MKKIFTLVMAISLLVAVGSSALSTPRVAALSGSDFNAGRIIDDAFFYQSSSMGASDIQTFLDSKVPTCDTNGDQMIYDSTYGDTVTRKVYSQRRGISTPFTCLKDYKMNTPPVNAESGICGYLPAYSNRTAAQIISDVSAACGVSPKVLIVLLQKEQGLVTDDWPWPVQYRSATGYGCPDTSACDSQYYGFFNQVYRAAWQFKLYQANPTNYNYVAGQNNTILWNPDSSCGTSTVFIQNQATAGLYNYTPYRPNAAALSNLYGTGDSCSSYGNRNFWRYYNDWFGPTLVTVLRARSDTCGQTGGDCTQYAIHDGIKQGIPSGDVLSAWGLDRLPLQTYSDSALQTIPNGNILSRFVRSSATGYHYFVDNASYHRVEDARVASAWNFPSSLSSVNANLLGILNNGGPLKPYISVDGSYTIYGMDAGQPRPISSATVYSLWAGPHQPAMQVSSAFFNTLTTGSAINSPLVSHGGTVYIANDKTLLTVSPAIQATLPSSWAPITVGDGLFATFASQGNLQYMVKGSGGTIYLLDNGTKRGFPNPQTYTAFQDAGSTVSSISDDLAGYIPSGPAVRGNIVATGGSHYIADHGLHKIPSSLEASYNIPAAVSITLASNYQNIISVSSQDATLFVRTTDSPAIYFMDAGKRLPFSSPSTFLLVGGGPIMHLVDSSMNQYPAGQVMNNYVTDGTSSYLIDNGKRERVADPPTAKAWRLDNPLTLSAADLATFSDGGILTQHIQRPNGLFCLVDSGTERCAGSMAMIQIWNLTSGVTHPSLLLLDHQGIGFSGLLQRFVKSSNGSPTVLTVTKGQFLGIRSMNNALNLGYDGTVVYLDPLTISSFRGPNWQGYLATDDAGNNWVLDGGKKRSVSATYTSAWLGSATPTPLGTAYLSMVSSADGISNSIRSVSGHTVYGMKNGEKYGIPSPDVYTASGLDPYTIVSESLLESIPYGGVWQN